MFLVIETEKVRFGLDSGLSLCIIMFMVTDRRTAMRVRRAALNLTQLQASRLVGMHMLRWNRIENSYTDPTPDEQKAIAKALKAKREDLFPELVAA